jgi:hypothetical protein
VNPFYASFANPLIISPTERLEAEACRRDTLKSN